MKNTYQFLYTSSAVIFIIVLLGGSITKPIFNSFASRSLETLGIKKFSVDSLDNKIDDILYTINKLNFQIERLKNLFSDEKADVSKLTKEKNEILLRNIYNPINEILITIYRLIFLLVSIILLFAAVITQLIYRGTDLRRRVEFLERRVKDLAAG
ncbi:MAG TPA: hypothetical protein VGK25_10135 [Ignavibacteria bacterium]|jgi:hypothetical protein